MSPRLRRSRLAALAPLVAAVLAATFAGAGPASADPDLAHARAAADALRTEVDGLHARAEAAAEQYGAVNDQLGDVVTALLLAESDVDAAQGQARTDASRADNLVRAAYMSGGSGALYASVLDGASISDVLDRLASVRSVLSMDLSTAGASRQRVVDAVAARDRVAQLTAQQRVLEDQRKAAADQAAALEEQARTLLASADALVARLVEQERAAAAARAEAAALAAMGGLPWGSVSVPSDEYAAVDAGIAAADPATPWAAAALRDLRRWLGTPYSAGGGGINGPGLGWCSSLAPDDGRLSDGTCAASSTVGFDCSSLMVRIFHAAGIDLPRTSRQQWFVGRHVSLAELKPGDLLFWAYDTADPATIHHVAVYLGDGLMANAPHTGDHVRVAPVYADGFIGAVRPA